MIVLKVGSSIVDLYGGESFQTEYNAFNVDDIGKRSGAISVEIAAPATNNNRSIFDNAQEVSSRTELPYIVLAAKLYVEGIDIGITRLILIKGNDKEFVFRLSDEDGALFFALKNKRMGELDLAAADHFQNGDEVAARINASSFVCYPLIRSLQDISSGLFGNSTRNVWSSVMIPCIYAELVIQRIFLEFGYGVVNNIENRTYFDGAKIVFPPAEDFRRNTDKERYLGTISNPGFVGTIQLDNTYLIELNPAVSTTGFFRGLFEDSSTPNQKNPTIVIADNISDLNIQLDFTFQNAGFSAVRFSVFWTKDDGTQLTAIKIQNYTVPAFTNIAISDVYLSDANQEFAQGNVLSVFILNTSVAIGSFISPSITINDCEVTNGGTVDPINRADYPMRYVTASSIVNQDWTYGKFLSEYLNLFSGQLQYDHMRKIVTINPFQATVENVANGLIWTEKLDQTDPADIEYSTKGFFQLSEFSYQKPLEDFPQLGGTNLSLVIDNKSLPNEGSVIESEFTSSTSHIGSIDLNYAYTPAYASVVLDVVPFDSLVSVEHNSIGQPVLLVKSYSDGTDLVLQKEADLFSPDTVNFPTFLKAWFIIPEIQGNLGFGLNLVNEFYEYVPNVIARFKKLICRLRLSAVDVRRLDFSKPVYLGQYQSFFYINKVTYDPASTESAEVELIKLTPYG
jgi:hypothetical protein